MPRIVDHAARRAELAEAVWSLIREQGLAGVTIRNLTERSGWSSGAIRHYLPHRQAILTFGAQHLNERIEHRLTHLPPAPDLREHLLQFLQVMLPLDDEGRLWMEVWLAYVGGAVSEQTYADTQGLLYENLNRQLTTLLQDLGQAGWALRHPPVDAAAHLHALLDGLGIHVLMQRMTPQQAKATLEVAVDDLLTVP